MKELQPSSPEILLDRERIGFNSCPRCRGKRVCLKCGGTGVHRILNSEGHCTAYHTCGDCYGVKKCDECEEHTKTLESIAKEIRSSSLGVAEATIRRALNLTDIEQAQIGQTNQIKGLGGGALVGTLFFPGVGTILGGLVGKMLAETNSINSTPEAVNWKRADLYFCLGILFSRTDRPSEAKQAWIMALTLFPNHIPSKEALNAT